MKFAKISQKLAMVAGSPKTFMGALILIGLWGLSGPIFNYNDTWQLIINTSTTIITFLMVFLIQNTLRNVMIVVEVLMISCQVSL